MKKIIALILCTIFMISLVACGGSQAPENDTKPAGAEESSGAKEPAGSRSEKDSTASLPEGAITDSDAKVYMIVPNAKIARYTAFDAPNVEKNLKVFAPNVKFTVLDAEGNAQKQVQQVESAIADGVKAMILLPVDSNTAGGMLSMLKEAGVLTLTYAHEGFGGPVDYHITTPFPTIAKHHAEYMDKMMRENELGRPYRVAQIWGQPGFAFYDDLKNTYKPYMDKWIKKGLVELVYEADANGWTSETSQPVMEQCLTKTQNQVDIVMTMNDDLGSGITAALSAQGLAGQVKIIGGCDATLEGIARVQAGWQEADITMDYAGMGKTAALIMATRLAGKQLPDGIINGAFDNKFVEGGVPAAYIDALLITKDNIKELVVDTGMYTQEQIDKVAAGMK
jgi:D-xylose transport system substrate-binding protein